MSDQAFRQFFSNHYVRYYQLISGTATASVRYQTPRLAASSNVFGPNSNLVFRSFCTILLRVHSIGHLRALIYNWWPQIRPASQHFFFSPIYNLMVMTNLRSWVLHLLLLRSIPFCTSAWSLGLCLIILGWSSNSLIFSAMLQRWISALLTGSKTSNEPPDKFGGNTFA